MAKVAVVLSGCGHKDGAEIREAVIALLALDREGAEVSIFAPNINQRKVTNHLTGEDTNETRNVLVEAARIARGNIEDLAKAKAQDFDALVLPGGFGAALSLSDVAIKGPDATVLPAIKQLISDFIDQKKPIGAICIAPAVLAAAVKGKLVPTVTIGEETDGNLIVGLGGKHQACPTNEMVFDKENVLVSCSAYMREDSIAQVAAGIEKLVHKVIELATQNQQGQRRSIA